MSVWRGRDGATGEVRRRRLIAYYLGAFATVTAVYTLAYMGLMGVVEDKPRTFGEALLVVVESFTTTGYGEDAGQWSSPVLQVFAVLMQATGVLFLFTALPVFAVPWIENRISTRVPRAVEDVRDHVLVCAHTPRTRMLLEELDSFDVPYVMVVRDDDLARDLYAEGIETVAGDPESTETLEAAGIEEARAVVADVGDESNASVALAARQICDGEIQVITFVEDRDVADYHTYAGADEVLSPRQLIGESLAEKVTTAVSADIEDAVEIDEDFEVVELPVQTGSDLDGVQVDESDVRERTGATIVGAWFRGEFVSPPSPDALIDSRTVLLVAGREAELEALKELTLSETRTREFGDVIICGQGEVGSTVRSSVATAGRPYTTVDVTDGPNVDIVGDATDPDVLESAGVADASTVVLALPSDTDAVFATLVIRNRNPDAEIVVRAGERTNVQKLYRAGADYVLALATVSGRMLASKILAEEVISVGQGIEILRVPVGRLAGQRIEEADIRARTGCTVLAVERGGEVLTNPDPSFRFQPGDEAVVVGPDQGVLELNELVS